MMTLDEINTAWAKDAVIDTVDIDKESATIPLKHAKYLKELSGQRIKLKRLNQKRFMLRRILGDYYRGEADQDDLKKLDRPQWDKMVMKSEVNTFIDTDETMIKFNIITIGQEEIVKTLEEILRQINIRGFHIRNIVEWRKLTNFGA